MKITDVKKYREIVDAFPTENKLFEQLHGKTILLTGATGMIGSFLVDTVMNYNRKIVEEDRISVISIARNVEKAASRFDAWKDSDKLTFISHDVSLAFPKLPCKPDYYIHAASTTHPVAYVNEPVNTILSNVFGLNNLLNLMSQYGSGRLLFLSSVEIYGENRGDTDRFTEDYSGYINCNTLRAGYQEAKRVCESLCQAYIRQAGIEAVILRLPRIYGATMQLNDSKAAAQFIMNGVRKENIVLKSQGTQFFSYANVYDAVSGILYTLLKGANGEAYNLGGETSEIMLRDLAKIIADYAGKEVVFELPDGKERAGYSTATKALMDCRKLRGLGWSEKYSIDRGVKESIDIISELLISHSS